MLQGVLGFKYEEEKHATGMTGLAGLPVYLDLPHMMGLPEQIGRRVEQQGMKRRERREMERRWRKKRWRSVPSPSAAFRY